MSAARRATPYTGTNAVKSHREDSLEGAAGGRSHAAARLEMGKRLAAGWSITAINTDLLMDPNDVSLALGILVEEARFLMDSGILTVVQRSEYGEDKVAFDELVWFVEQSGWLQVRAAKSLEYLRSEAERLPRRAEILRREAAAKAEESADEARLAS